MWQYSAAAQSGKAELAVPQEKGTNTNRARAAIRREERRKHGSGPCAAYTYVLRIPLRTTTDQKPIHEGSSEHAARLAPCWHHAAEHSTGRYDTRWHAMTSLPTSHAHVREARKASRSQIGGATMSRTRGARAGRKRSAGGSAPPEARPQLARAAERRARRRRLRARRGGARRRGREGRAGAAPAHTTATIIQR